MPVESSQHAVPTCVGGLLAEPLLELVGDVADEAGGLDHIGRHEHVVRRAEVFLESLVGLVLSCKVRPHHRVQDQALAVLGAGPVGEGIVVGRVLGDPRQHRSLGQVQLRGRDVEVIAGRRLAAVGVMTVENGVQVHLQDLVLGEGAIDLDRKQGLLRLAFESRRVVEQPQLDQLLGDGGGALDRLVLAPIDPGRPSDALGIDSGLVIEVQILDCDRGVGQVLAHGAELLVVVLVAGWVEVGQLLAVGGEDQRVLGQRLAGQGLGVGQLRGDVYVRVGADQEGQRGQSEHGHDLEDGRDHPERRRPPVALFRGMATRAVTVEAGPTATTLPRFQQLAVMLVLAPRGELGFDESHGPCQR